MRLISQPSRQLVNKQSSGYRVSLQAWKDRKKSQSPGPQEIYTYSHPSFPHVQPEARSLKDNTNSLYFSVTMTCTLEFHSKEAVEEISRRDKSSGEQPLPPQGRFTSLTAQVKSPESTKWQSLLPSRWLELALNTTAFVCKSLSCF